MTALEPTPERIAVLRMAASKRLYLNTKDLRVRYQLGLNYATDAEKVELDAILDAGLIAMGDPDAWLTIGDRLVQQMTITTHGSQWLARAEQESAR